MKEVTKKELPEVSGGEFPQEGCIPNPLLSGPEGESTGRERGFDVENPLKPDA